MFDQPTSGGVGDPYEFEERLFRVLPLNQWPTVWTTRESNPDLERIELVRPTGGVRVSVWRAAREVEEHARGSVRTRALAFTRCHPGSAAMSCVVCRPLAWGALLLRAHTSRLNRTVARLRELSQPCPKRRTTTAVEGLVALSTQRPEGAATSNV